MRYAGKDSAVNLARAELKKEKRDKALQHSLFFVGALALILLVFFSFLHYMNLTGYASSVDSSAGSITEIELKSKTDVSVWSGLYGFALRVSGFSEQESEILGSATIKRTDVFFDCIKNDATGGPELFASTNSSLDLTSSNIDNIKPGDPEWIDDNLISCSDKEYCANNTYTGNMTIYIGETRVSEIPSTHTFRYDGLNEVFDIGILNISNNLVYVTHINSTTQKGYSPNVTVNFQMLIPMAANTSDTFYFFVDPNDVCPTGGIGNSLNATIFGYVLDTNGTAVPNATVTLAGFSTLSGSDGFYNLSSLVLVGTYNMITQRTGYDLNITDIVITESNATVRQNVTLPIHTPGIGDSFTLRVFGFVKDTNGVALNDVNISLGNATTLSNSSGFYEFYPLVVSGENPIVAIKQNYDNYYELLDLNSSLSELNHNITMTPANLFATGPFPEEGDDDEEGDSFGEVDQVQAVAEEAGQDFWVAPSEINRQVRQNTFVEERVNIYNFKASTMQVSFTVSSELADFVRLDKGALSIGTDSFDGFTVTILGTKPIGVYRGIIDINGDLDTEIPVTIEIVPKRFSIETLGMEIDLFRSIARPGSPLKYKLDLQNLLTDQNYKIDLKHMVLDGNGSRILLTRSEDVEIRNSLSLVREIQIPGNFSDGEYLLKIDADYAGLFSSITVPFRVARPIYLYSFFGIPLWIIFVFISVISFIALNVFLYKRHLEKKKRYHISLYTDTLPKPGPRSIKIGRLAESKIPAYYDLDAFTTHAIVAGATGGGKSISAQVFIEEVLTKDIAVVVFDPTAQWSGMLRKCDDKKMLSFYPKFGLKASDARAFPGNVRQVKNYRESIDVNKYINPGQIQIFTLNKLDPKQIDIFVAGVIANIFRSDPKEHAGLKVMLVFDEVHRLLPKFGGSGKGFLQIERACREFRKWGFGVMLVSQVLSDFVGEIKANINTEVQMRVAEENDLQRIKERYGMDALKSLVKADIGTGMIQNAEYNRGLPYFVNFRPILHNTRRLSDEVLDRYNQYSMTIEDLEYQIEQLEKEKVDTFDLKMELKLVKDKLMTGNFTVVDIYLEGLQPRIEKQWESIGKKPKKKEIELLNVEELESSIAEAKKDRKKAEEEEKEEGKEEKEEKKEEKKEEEKKEPEKKKEEKKGGKKKKAERKGRRK